ncbi:hypothetical protein Thexy_0756 [Thermoanaerobacterium xylanolyticum LX-11]|uniref:TNT domain-containing protein n=1 Tax=Thermoanaerobacterium xylanolyticum (strain ATCC 49914 / DSM 7097 / LX-11) TaxID=858215 RepID=F6BIQ5_THEXL|nr:TNT domain-containing protein [Thermoanaerobacterium xylanolyticum]AEF16799.1 hypothetical protein Thexy_0756 [Thermoanaerobacterium xylanolyticum LX-11]
MYKTYDKNGKTQTTSFFSIVKNFGEGLGEAVEDTAKGIVSIATHPKEVVKGIEYVVSHPAETVDTIKNEAIKTYNEFKNGDANTKAKILGDITGEVALSVIGTKGIDKAVKGIEEAGVIARTAEAAEAVSDVANAEKAVGVAEKAIENVSMTTEKVETTTVKEAASSSSKVASKWLDENGKYIWPPNDGFEGAPVKKVFKPGERFDRYGKETGEFTAPVGTPFEMRSLPSEYKNSVPYNVYEVVKPFEALEGKTAPWFDQPGGGTQCKLPKTIKELINEGYIRKVEK